MEQTREFDYLGEVKLEISEARENIQKELDRKTGAKWFDCFATVSNEVLGYFELAQARSHLPEKEADNWKLNAQALKDEIERRRKDAEKKGLDSVEVDDEEDQEKLLGMLDIFREPETSVDK